VPNHNIRSHQPPDPAFVDGLYSCEDRLNPVRLPSSDWGAYTGRRGSSLAQYQRGRKIRNYHGCDCPRSILLDLAMLTAALKRKHN
jgi:hypothetical protein